MENRKLMRNYEDFDLHDDLPVTPGVYYPRNRKISHRKKVLKNERVVFKNGDFNIEKADAKMFKISNWFISMVEARWRWTLQNFFLAFTIEWLLFGFIYWTIALTHGDLEFNEYQYSLNETGFIPCIENIYGFTSAFLFSIEVHTTVAYGRRSITLECPQAILAMCIQCILSSIFQAFMVGILFAKLTRPKARTHTILFSKNAVVNVKDDKLCLVYRVGDVRTSRILNIKGLLFILRMTSENNALYNEQVELSTEIYGCESTFFLWPISVIHVIDEKSPLYNISAADLLCGKIEILAVFEGTIETTGQPIQARSSYTSNDILWGHRFISMVSFDCKKDVYDVDFSKLSETEQIDTPLCSAKEYQDAVSRMESLIDINGVENDIDMYLTNCEKGNK